MDGLLTASATASVAFLGNVLQQSSGGTAPSGKGKNGGSNKRGGKGGTKSSMAQDASGGSAMQPMPSYDIPSPHLAAGTSFQLCGNELLRISLYWQTTPRHVVIDATLFCFDDRDPVGAAPRHYVSMARPALQHQRVLHRRRIQNRFGRMQQGGGDAAYDPLGASMSLEEQGDSFEIDLRTVDRHISGFLLSAVLFSHPSSSPPSASTAAAVTAPGSPSAPSGSRKPSTAFGSESPPAMLRQLPVDEVTSLVQLNGLHVRVEKVTPPPTSANGSPGSPRSQRVGSPRTMESSSAAANDFNGPQVSVLANIPIIMPTSPSQRGNVVSDFYPPWPCPNTANVTTVAKPPSPPQSQPRSGLSSKRGSVAQPIAPPTLPPPPPAPQGPPIVNDEWVSQSTDVALERGASALNAFFGLMLRKVRGVDKELEATSMSPLSTTGGGGTSSVASPSLGISNSKKKNSVMVLNSSNGSASNAGQQQQVSSAPPPESTETRYASATGSARSLSTFFFPSWVTPSMAMTSVKSAVTSSSSPLLPLSPQPTSTGPQSISSPSSPREGGGGIATTSTKPTVVVLPPTYIWEVIALNEVFWCGNRLMKPTQQQQRLAAHNPKQLPSPRREGASGSGDEEAEEATLVEDDGNMRVDDDDDSGVVIVETDVGALHRAARLRHLVNPRRFVAPLLMYPTLDDRQRVREAAAAATAALLSNSQRGSLAKGSGTSMNTSLPHLSNVDIETDDEDEDEGVAEVLRQLTSMKLLHATRQSCSLKEGLPQAMSSEGGRRSRSQNAVVEVNDVCEVTSPSPPVSPNHHQLEIGTLVDSAPAPPLGVPEVATAASIAASAQQLERLLCTVPRIVREADCKYNIGRPAVTAAAAAAAAANRLRSKGGGSVPISGMPAADVDSSDEEDEAVMASMKALAQAPAILLPSVRSMPTAPKVIRFAGQTYSIGSSVDTLKRHYVEKRADYEDAQEQRLTSAMNNSNTMGAEPPGASDASAAAAAALGAAGRDGAIELPSDPESLLDGPATLKPSLPPAMQSHVETQKMEQWRSYQLQQQQVMMAAMAAQQQYQQQLHVHQQYSQLVGSGGLMALSDAPASSSPAMPRNALLSGSNDPGGIFAGIPKPSSSSRSRSPRATGASSQPHGGRLSPAAAQHAVANTRAGIMSSAGFSLGSSRRSPTATGRPPLQATADLHAPTPHRLEGQQPFAPRHSTPHQPRSTSSRSGGGIGSSNPSRLAGGIATRRDGGGGGVSSGAATARTAPTGLARPPIVQKASSQSSRLWTPQEQSTRSQKQQQSFATPADQIMSHPQRMMQLTSPRQRQQQQPQTIGSSGRKGPSTGYGNNTSSASAAGGFMPRVATGNVTPPVPSFLPPAAVTVPHSGGKKRSGFQQQQQQQQQQPPLSSHRMPITQTSPYPPLPPVAHHDAPFPPHAAMRGGGGASSSRRPPADPPSNDKAAGIADGAAAAAAMPSFSQTMLDGLQLPAVPSASVPFSNQYGGEFGQQFKHLALRDSTFTPNGAPPVIGSYGTLLQRQPPSDVPIDHHAAAVAAVRAQNQQQNQRTVPTSPLLQSIMSSQKQQQQHPQQFQPHESSTPSFEQQQQQRATSTSRHTFKPSPQYTAPVVNLSALKRSTRSPNSNTLALNCTSPSRNGGTNGSGGPRAVVDSLIGSLVAAHEKTVQQEHVERRQSLSSSMASHPNATTTTVSEKPRGGSSTRSPPSSSSGLLLPPGASGGGHHSRSRRRSSHIMMATVTEFVEERFPQLSTTTTATVASAAHHPSKLPLPPSPQTRLLH